MMNTFSTSISCSMLFNRTLFSILFLAALCTSSAQNTQDYRDYYKASKAIADQQVFKSSINYGPIAEQICVGCTDDYQRARAIYQWVCSHIAYDTSYKIRSADECYKKQKGVCQGYCELYYQLAKAVGVRVEIIMGKSKDQTGYINPAGHGWLFAYTAADRGILMDPTWGAGSVTPEGFVREEDPIQWFNVDPEWMILSHFPEQKGYQLLERPLSEKTFLAIPPVNNLWTQYGVNVHQLYEKTVTNTLALPQFYNQGEQHIQFLEIPMAPTLRVGQTYQFRIRMTSPRDFAIMNNSVLVNADEWTAEADGCYSISYMPRDVESLSICIRDASNQSWSTVLKYDIAEPTSTDWKLVEARYPAYAPEMKAVKNMNAALWREAGIDERRMLDIVRDQHIVELPVFYDGKAQYFTIEAVPMTRQLVVGQSYTFAIYPKGFGNQWAVVNGGEWSTDWKVSDNGLHSITVTPMAEGMLGLYLQTDANDSYWPCLEYIVKTQP